MSQTTRKAPEDRKPPKSAGFAFTDKDGRWQTIPYATEVLERLEFGAITDILGVDMNEASNKIARSLLDLLDPESAGVVALKSLPVKSGMATFARWFQAPDANGVTVGELLAS